MSRTVDLLLTRSPADSTPDGVRFIPSGPLPYHQRLLSANWMGQVTTYLTMNPDDLFEWFFTPPPNVADSEQLVVHHRFFDAMSRILADQPSWAVVLETNQGTGVRQVISSPQEVGRCIIDFATSPEVQTVGTLVIRNADPASGA